MQGIKIVSTGRALPEKVVTNDDMSLMVDTNDEWIYSRTGIKQRYKCENEDCTSLAVKAAKKAVEKASIDVEQIGFVVVATTTSVNIFPSTACIVQKELGLLEDVMSFDIAAACTGFMYGLEICRGLLLNSSKKYALLIGSEELSRILDYTDRSTCVLFGDGAAAAVLSLSENLFIHKAWSDGDKNAEILSCKGVGRASSYINMDGKKVFKFAVTVLKSSIDEILEEAGLSLEDIDYVICHQANKRIIEHIIKKYRITEEKFFMNIERYANTSAASIPIALDELYENNMLRPGMKVICTGFGAGFTWSSALITI